jgi:FkbM family methyltransferase
MTQFKFRPGTNDVNIFNDASDKDYRLPDIINPGDVIVDIGAHIGGFIYGCLKRGATNIYAYEAMEENYNIARHNFEDEIKKGIVKLYNVAVWRSDIPKTTLHNSGYHKNIAFQNTGISNVFGDTNTGATIETISLDEIINSVGKIKLLKIDCEGSEYPILLTCTKLSLVEYICGEYHIINVNDLSEVKNFEGLSFIQNGGKIVYDGTLLSRYLDTKNFSTILFNSPLTLFFCRRKDLQDNYFKEVRF